MNIVTLVKVSIISYEFVILQILNLFALILSFKIHKLTSQNYKIKDYFYETHGVVKGQYWNN